MEKTPNKLPVITTRGILSFPKFTTFIEVGRLRSVNAINESIANYNSRLIVVSQKDSLKDKVEASKDIFKVGTLVSFVIDKTYSENAYRIKITGIDRVKLTTLDIQPGIISSRFKIISNINKDASEEEALVRRLSSLLETTIGNNVEVPKNVLKDLSSGTSAGELADIIGQFMPMNILKRQKLLELADVNERLKFASAIISEEQQIIKIEKDIDKDVKNVLDKQQKEFLLREKLKVIKEQLGDVAGKDSDIDEYRRKLKEGKYPKHVKDAMEKEIRKYEAMPPISAEANVSKTYIETVLDIPWWQTTKDENDLANAKRILNKHHHGLNVVKERIIEYLAVQLNTKSQESPILTLLGPPGVGKTSLARSIGEAAGRKVIKVSLGGVRDEAEIRGHRRTYIGSMPGKIIAAVKKSGVSNPLILLDEIDKMSSDFRGDPASAMLEVLDPEQNKLFQDHYLELEYDLSKVMFVATANYYQNIPEALLDRVELIELSSYTEHEKVKIAKKHLIKSVLKSNGLKSKNFKISDETILYLIRRYTMEAGVRGLRRVLDKLARKIVVQILTKKLSGNGYVVSKENARKMLGAEKVDIEKKAKKAQVGVVTGLAYTAYGGSILPIEVNTFQGKGELKLTGSIKEVMKESASIALGFVRANAKKFGINPTFFEKNDIHVHVPAGAVPKDGPSAGVTFTTALISAIKGVPISEGIGMTGEITLRGHVLQIGGLKEKSISAHRSKLETIFIPKSNVKNLEDVPKEVQKELKIVPVEKYIEIFEHIFKNKK